MMDGEDFDHWCFDGMFEVLEGRWGAVDRVFGEEDFGYWWRAVDGEDVGHWFFYGRLKGGVFDDEGLSSTGFWTVKGCCLEGFFDGEGQGWMAMVIMFSVWFDVVLGGGF